jgi:hypothetical protein
MNRTELEKAVAAKEFEFYESIARLIVDNPAVRLADLRKQHGISFHDMLKAQRMFQVRRKTGKGSPAYGKATHE